MRNLKKILALVLALVMSMSLMATANAFTDDASIEADYEEAVKVLAGIGVYKGYENADGTFAFNPKATITREEVAAIMYRIASGDVTDKQNALYVEGADFTDVKATAWSAGYIGYCANGGIIIGNGDGTFGPKAQVTGYQVLAMALRAVGYDKNGEFSGADWAKNVATTAEKLNILKNVPGTVQLSKPATRELVAELIFQTIATVDMVEYTPAFGYQPVTFAFTNIWGSATQTLGEEQFALTPAAAEQDEWGRPMYGWTYNCGDKKTMFVEDHVEFYTAVTECDVATATKQKTNVKEYTTYTNGILNSAVDTITATATTAKIGAQGRLTEVYPASGKIVYIDTLLAKVTDVKAATYDAAGHLKTESSITLNIYDTNTADMDAGYETVILTNGKTNYAYAKNDIVLVSAVQDVYGNVRKDAYQHVEIQGLADAKVGAQSTIWFNAEQHTVDGTIYNDNNRFHLDEAGYETTNHTWYFDGQGNLIGVIDIDTIYAYGVLSSLYWVNDGSNYGAGAAYGVITYMDGTKSGIVEIDAIDGKETTYARYGDNVGAAYAGGKFGVSTYALDNAGLLMTELYEIETQADGTLLLTKQSKTADATNSIKTGVSAVVGETLYADNFTQYLVYNTTTKEFSAVTGYENIANFSNIEFCYKNGTTFLKYVFIKATPDEASASDFVFFTNTGASFTLAKLGGVDVITISGVVRADGSTTPIVVAANAAGTTAQTLAALQTTFADAIGKLYVVPTVGGIVTAAKFGDIKEVTATGETIGTNVAVYEGTPSNYTANGVLIVDGVYYNVNKTTTIVTKDGVGTTADLTAAVVNGKQVYVVYKTSATTTATAIFVTEYSALAAAKVEAKAALEFYAGEAAKYDNVDVKDASVQAVLTAQKAAVDAATTYAQVTAIVDSTNWTGTGVVAIDAATEALKAQAAVTVNVKNTTELNAALASYNEGDIIVLAEGYYDFESSTSTQVDLLKDVTIRGKGNVVIYSKEPVNAQGATVTLENLTFVKNNAGQVAVTAYNNADSELIIDGCTFVSSVAENCVAVYINPKGTLTVTDSTFDFACEAIVSQSAWTQMTITGNTFVNPAVALSMDHTYVGAMESEVEEAVIADNTGITADLVKIF